MSSRKSTAQRRIDELLDRLLPGDIVIASELSRLGRSIKETLTLYDFFQNLKIFFVTWGVTKNQVIAPY